MPVKLPPSVLTQKQERFCQNRGAKNMSQIASYRDAFGCEGIPDNRISTLASILDARPEVQARIKTIQERVLGEVAKVGAFTLSAALAEADRANELAHSVGQAGAAVSAVTLKAKLAGLLVEKKEIRSGPLEETDIFALLAMRDQIRQRIEVDKSVADLIGDAPAALRPSNQPARRELH